MAGTLGHSINIRRTKKGWCLLKYSLGTTSGALLRSDTVDCKQQRVTLMIQNTLSDGVDTHVTTRLSFKPTCFTAASLTLHPPASHFRSTTLHVNYSSSH